MSDLALPARPQRRRGNCGVPLLQRHRPSLLRLPPGAGPDGSGASVGIYQDAKIG